MQTKTRIEYAARVDGKFNIWRKSDVIYHDNRPPLYGEWEIIGVRNTRDEAVIAWREARAGR